MIRDVAAGIEADHLTLLSDIVHVRNAIWSTLREPTREKLLKGSYVAINLLCPGGYEFAVGFLAIVALGAVVSPISMSTNPFYIGPPRFATVIKPLALLIIRRICE